MDVSHESLGLAKYRTMFQSILIVRWYGSDFLIINFSKWRLIVSSISRYSKSHFDHLLKYCYSLLHTWEEARRNTYCLFKLESRGKTLTKVYSTQTTKSQKGKRRIWTVTQTAKRGKSKKHVTDTLWQREWLRPVAHQPERRRLLWLQV
jgi:hypothetical protein